METSSQPTSATTATKSWRAALASIPLDVQRVHHGRDPQIGLDCIGFAMALYRAAGIDLSELDLPYAATDAKRAHRFALMLRQLHKRFRPVPVSMALQDGDLVLFKIGAETDTHLAVVVGQQVWMMTDRLKAVAKGQCLPLARWAFRFAR